VQGVQLGRSREAGDDMLPKQLKLSGFVYERPDEDPSCAGFDECRDSLGAQCRGADQQRGRSQLVDRAVQHRGQHIGEHPVSLAGVFGDVQPGRRDCAWKRFRRLSDAP
jgi:hypothetical protein